MKTVTVITNYVRQSLVALPLSDRPTLHMGHYALVIAQCTIYYVWRRKGFGAAFAASEATAAAAAATTTMAETALKHVN